MLNLILFISDTISIILNNLISLLVYPINLLANILYQIGERIGLIEETPEEKEKNNPIGFQILSDKTKVECEN